MIPPVVCLVFKSHNVGKSILEDFSATLRGHVKIVGQSLAELEAGPMDAEYFIVPSSRAAEIVKLSRPNSKTIVSSYTLNIRELPRLLMLRYGTTCLVIAGTQESAEHVIRILREFGFTWLNFNPYWPGKNSPPLNGEIAITLGTPHLCPADVSDIIDLGPRRLDITALITLCLDLNLPRKLINEILMDHLDQMTSLGRAYLEVYQESERDRAYLKVLLNSTKDAIAAFDRNGSVMYSNTFFKRLIKGTNLNKFLEDQFTSPSVEQIKGKHFLVEKLSVKVQEETKPLGTLVVIRSTENVSKAEGTLRRTLLAKRHVALYHFSDIIGNSPLIKKAIDTAKKIASSNLTVLIAGETGTGKELFAHAIHNASSRANEPFVCAHFAAMPPSLIESELFGYDEGAFTGAKKGGHPGFFEQAHKGSIFLDEIGDIPIPFQSHLLRVLEDKRVTRISGQYPIPMDVRLIAATNQDLEALVKQNRFREDLFYRLNVIPLSLPPLRSRTEDIPILANHFLSLVDRSNDRRFSSQVLEYLQNCSWPGNARQLESIVKYMAHISENEILDVADLPPGLKVKSPAVSTGHSNEMMKDWKNDRDLISLILDTLFLFQKSGKSVGKKALIVRAKEEGFNLSDYRMRKLLRELNDKGLIHVGSTSQGTVITDKGLTFLRSLSGGVDASQYRNGHSVVTFSEKQPYHK